MSKAVLISIKPRWCRKITNAEKIKIFPRDKTIEVKTIEVRKTRPMKIRTPLPCLIYCTLDYENMYYDVKRKCVLNGKVIGEFVCDKIIKVNCDSVDLFDDETKQYIGKECCLNVAEYHKYTLFKSFGWHISDLKIYDEPKELSEFGLTRPPQSWCYVEAENA